MDHYALSGSCLGSTHDQTTTLPSAASSRTYCSHVFDLACIAATAAGHGIPARASTLSRPCSLAIDSARRGASAPERNNIRFRPAHGDHTAGRWARSFSVRHAKAAQLTSRMHAPERIQSARVCRLQAVLMYASAPRNNDEFGASLPVACRSQQCPSAGASDALR